MPTAIAVEHLSKKYLISHRQPERYTALRDVVAGGIREFGRKLLGTLAGAGAGDKNFSSSEEFWALQDLNFEIHQGDRVGIIGRNGAGKSTLLKILSRVTEPTTGRIRITGRVASLLEVGTGFHPELTGRENIFLNGAVLGMSRREISRKFDEIVDFAEVEKFLDTPVKRYSSGMYVRLAFAVAAHLEPEVLLVDEVLAVGDQEFQRKCLGKMKSAGSEGRTVLFVSHNMGAVLNLCEKGILLAGGRAQMFPDVSSCVRKYTEHALAPTADIVQFSDRQRPAQSYLRFAAKFLSARPIAEAQKRSWCVPFPHMPAIEYSIAVAQPLPNLVIQIAVFNSSGMEIVTSHSSDELILDDVRPGIMKITARYHDSVMLVPGRYSLNLGLRTDLGQEDIVNEAIEFEIAESEQSGQMQTHHRRGVIVPRMSYELEPVWQAAVDVSRRA